MGQCLNLVIEKQSYSKIFRQELHKRVFQETKRGLSAKNVALETKEAVTL